MVNSLYAHILLYLHSLTSILNIHKAEERAKTNPRFSLRPYFQSASANFLLTETNGKCMRDFSGGSNPF